MSDLIREIEQDRLRAQLMGPKCHPMADNFDEETEADGPDEDVTEGESA